jgi:hypothetical protein
VRLGEDDSLNGAALQQHALQLAQHYGSSPRSLVFVNLVDKSQDQVSTYTCDAPHQLLNLSVLNLYTYIHTKMALYMCVLFVCIAVFW